VQRSGVASQQCGFGKLEISKVQILEIEISGDQK
jgi:hypothetical protein